MLAVLTLVILGGTQALNQYFLSPVSIKSMLSFLSILTFLSSAQLATVLVGAIDLSIGPLAGLCVVLASFLAPDGVAAGPLAAGLILILMATTGFGLLQGLLITSLRSAGDRRDDRDLHRAAGRLAAAAAGRRRPHRRCHLRCRAVSTLVPAGRTWRWPW